METVLGLVSGDGASTGPCVSAYFCCFVRGRGRGRGRGGGGVNTWMLFLVARASVFTPLCMCLLPCRF